MHCLRCGRQNKANNEYCEGCGAALGITCSACQHVNGPTALFCGQCGAALKPTAPQPANQSWHQVLASLNAKGGERKRLTILFADIRNSTGLIDSLGDPEIGMRRLQPVLDLMKEAVARYEGVVNKSQGDGVMAIFGAPQPHEDHAVRGCLAALAMQDGVMRLGDPDLQIRVGLHTGEVETIDDKAGGLAVAIGARVASLAGPDEVLVSSTVRDLVAGSGLLFEDAGEHELKGVPDRWRLYKVIG